MLNNPIILGTKLPTLTNPGAAGDLLAGKQLIDQNGNVLTGTMIDCSNVEAEFIIGTGGVSGATKTRIQYTAECKPTDLLAIYAEAPDLTLETLTEYTKQMEVNESHVIGICSFFWNGVSLLHGLTCIRANGYAKTPTISPAMFLTEYTGDSSVTFYTSEYCLVTLDISKSAYKFYDKASLPWTAFTFK